MTNKSVRSETADLLPCFCYVLFEACFAKLYFVNFSNPVQYFVASWKQPNIYVALRFL